MLETGKESSSLWVYLGSYALLFYFAVLKKTLTSTLHTDQVIIGPLSFIVKHKHLQCRGPEWDVPSKLMCYLYFKRNSVQLKEVIVFAYGDSWISRPALPATKADCHAANVAGHPGVAGIEVYFEGNKDVSVPWNYFFFSKLIERPVWVSSLVLSVLLFCLQRILFEMYI